MTQQCHYWAHTLRKITSQEKDTCTPMFIVALYTIARTWKQPRYPSTDEWINKMWYIDSLPEHICKAIFPNKATFPGLGLRSGISGDHKQPLRPGNAGTIIPI